MTRFGYATAAATLFLVLLGWSGGWADQGVLKVYGPGGPLAPVKECGEAFARVHGVKVEVTAGPDEQWLSQAKQDADLIFSGAEYSLTRFIMDNPGFLDEKTRTTLHIRPSGVLVRKGNPKKIKSPADLTKEGIKLLDVNGAGQLGLWEDMCADLIPDIRKNIAVSVPNTATAVEKWKSMPELDAWITFESWHYRLKDETELVNLPDEEKLYRGTPIAVTAMSKNRDDALKFIDYMKSSKGRAIFKKWGWK